MYKLNGGANRLLLLKKQNSKIGKKTSQALKYKIQAEVRKLHNLHIKLNKSPPTKIQIDELKRKIMKSGVSQAEVNNVMNFGFKAGRKTKKRKRKVTGRRKRKVTGRRKRKVTGRRRKRKK